MHWCEDKQLLRVATHGILPEAVRRRPKAPLAGNPIVQLLRQPGMEWVDRFIPTSELAKYVYRDAIPRIAGECELDEVEMNLRPLCLNNWLRHLIPFKYNPKQEANNE